MHYIEIHPDRQLLVAWAARQQRQRLIMIRRRLIPWHERRWAPAFAQERVVQIDAVLKQNAHDYWARGTP